MSRMTARSCSVNVLSIYLLLLLLESAAFAKQPRHIIFIEIGFLIKSIHCNPEIMVNHFYRGHFAHIVG